VIYSLRYVDPRCPALAGLTRTSDAEQIDALKARLVHDGYLVTDITPNHVDCPGERSSISWGLA
jgi:hypothetical protein